MIARIILILAVTMSPVARPGWTQSAESSNAEFEWFEYEGRDIVEETMPVDSYRNPVLAGFYPDPSVCRVGEDYYLVTSSFSYFPGVPLFHSRDLVRWTQLGHVLSRPSQLKLDGLQVSEGVFAPSIRHNAGTFYMITTLVGGGGNFFVTASDPAGPWSDPVWLPEIDGIDPSFFFDDDGRAYVVNNGLPPEGRVLYEGHRAIWIQEFDLKTQRLIGPREIIVNGGVDITKRPVWIEGPHIFKKAGWYVLIAAEGGTAEDHSEVVFRSRGVRGPYVPWDKNPILTQRTLDPNRPNPVTSTGHADFVETPDGSWWAVFLGCRPYEGRLYNTGRETFMLPVTWADDWPAIIAPNTPVPTTGAAPKLPPMPRPEVPLNGSFTWRDDFDRPSLAPLWNFLRAPGDIWLSLTQKPGTLVIRPGATTLSSRGNPSFIGRRQQHARFSATAALRLRLAPGHSAGLVAFQNETHHFYLGVRSVGGGAEVFLERVADSDQNAAPQTIARLPIAGPPSETALLRIEGQGRIYDFSYATRPDDWISIKKSEDGSILSTAVAGGFVGAYIGLHARIDPQPDASREYPDQ
ncbi:MAG: glycoside hydrolase family 43 protein [Vicinamibacteria bacterium]|nr:glycoside hydrolase family 43 protein [Vicinamibacteria bacterium]